MGRRPTRATCALMIALVAVLAMGSGAWARVRQQEKVYDAVGVDAGGDAYGALTAAYKDAVSQAVAELVPDEAVRAKHATTIEKEVVAKAADETFIIEYDAERMEQTDANGCTVKVPITVDVSGVNLALIAAGVKVVPLAIMCVVQQTVVDEPALGGSEAQGVVEDALAAAGYTVRTAIGAGVEDLIGIDTGEVNRLKAIEVAKREKADVLIIGQAIAEQGGKQGKRLIVRASCSLKAIMVQTGQVCGAASAEATEQDTSIQIGARRASKAACESALADLLAAFPPEGETEVTFSQLYSRDQYEALAKELQKLDMIKQVVLGDADFQKGSVTFRVTSRLGSDLLATALRLVPFPPVEVNQIQGMAIQAQILSVRLVINDLERASTLDAVEKELRKQAEAADLRVSDKADKQFDREAKKGSITIYGLTADEIQKLLDEVRWIRIKSFNNDVAEIEVFEK